VIWLDSKRVVPACALALCSSLLMYKMCAQGDDVFFAATGVSDGDLLQGVRYYSGGASTTSLVMRARSGTSACRCTWFAMPVLMSGASCNEWTV